MSDQNLPAIQTKQIEAAQVKATSLVEKYRSEKALVFINDKDLQTHALFIPEITLLKVNPDEFHNINGKRMPKSHVVDRIGEAAGISFIAAECQTRTEGDWIYIGRAQGKKRMPDGTWRASHVHEYEFDVDTRAELDFNGKYADKYKTEQARLLHKLEMKKFARARAGTGARMKVIRELVGMPTGLEPKNIAGGQMAFARVALNTQRMLAEPEMRQAIIKNAIGATEDIFGPAAPPRDVTPELEESPRFGSEPIQLTEEQIKDDVMHQQPAPKDAEQAEPEAAPDHRAAASTSGSPGLPADDEIPGFDGPAVELDQERDQLRSWFEMRIAEVAAAETKAWIQDFLDGKIADKNSQNVETLRHYKATLEKHLASGGGGK